MSLFEKFPPHLRWQWRLLLILIVVVLAGGGAAHINSWPVKIPLVLSEGQSLQISVFRLLPDSLRMSLRFENPGRSVRSELGLNQGGRRIGGRYVYSLPGDPVLIEASVSGRSVVFEAKPGNHFGADHVWRNLVVLEEDGGPSRFSKPPANVVPQMSSGVSVISLKVVKVGKSLINEQVVLFVEPPMSFKAHMPGYGFLWWFYFWPFYGLVLSIWLAYLLWQTRCSKLGGMSGMAVSTPKTSR